MINLRYHIVSLTAVFLALGLGLTMGSTFLDRATVETLNNQLTDLEGELGRSDTRINELQRELSDLRSAAETFDEQALEPLLAGELTDAPVMVVAVRGTDDELVERSLDGLLAAGASVDGVWWATERFVLDDGGERRDLADVLGLATDLEVRLRRTVAQRLAVALAQRAETAPAAEPGPSGDAEPTTTTAVAAPELADVDPLVDALRSAGFLEFEAVGDVPGPRMPGAGLRLVLISGPAADVTVGQFLVPLLQDLADSGPVPAVLASGVADGDDPERRAVVVDAVRDDETLASVVSTVDDLERFSGLAALVLATRDIADGAVNHLGVADTASRLLPTRDPPS